MDTCNLHLVRGQTAFITVAIRATEAADAPPADLTGWTMKYSLRRRYGQPVLVEKDVGAVDALAGTAGIPLAVIDTDWEAGAYVWDLWRTNPGAETPLTKGVEYIEDRVWDGDGQNPGRAGAGTAIYLSGSKGPRGGGQGPVRGLGPPAGAGAGGAVGAAE